ncbi:hypothetical protein FRC07_006405, partial [Ceratobasidium sp. 392]
MVASWKNRPPQPSPTCRIGVEVTEVLEDLREMVTAIVSGIGMTGGILGTGDMTGEEANAGGVVHAVLEEMVEVGEVNVTQGTGVRVIPAVTTDRETGQTTEEIPDVMIVIGRIGTMTDDLLGGMMGVNEKTGGTSHVHGNRRQRTQRRNPDVPPNPPADSSKSPAAGGVDGEIEEGEDMEEDEAQMMAAMGFGGFDSTK